VSPVIETEHGFHLLKVEERRELRTKSLEEVREELRTRIENEKYNEGIDAFVKKAREEADVWVSPKYANRYVPQNE
jgi:parvulin-like peptidyl-prolyl isomerase